MIYFEILIRSRCSIELSTKEVEGNLYWALKGVIGSQFQKHHEPSSISCGSNYTGMTGSQALWLSDIDIENLSAESATMQIVYELPGYTK